MRKTKDLLKCALSAILAVAMALVLLPANALAADTYTLTLKGTTTGHTYEAYQIFTGDLSTGTDGTKTLSNVQWGPGVTYTGTETASEVAEKLANKTMTIEQLEEKLTLTTPAKTVTSAEGSTVIDGLDAGYYLVKDKDGTQTDTSDAYTKFIVQVVGDATSAIKSGVPTVTKKVKDTNDSTGVTSDWQDSADADVNDDVSYQITGTLPSNYADYSTYKYVFTDTISKGLTYTAKNAKITLYKDAVDTKGIDITSHFTEAIADYSGTDTNYTGGQVLTWTENDKEGLKAIDGITSESKIVVTYTAKLNSDAKIGAAGNPNKVDLTYSNNPNRGGDGKTGKTPEDKNIVFTYKVTVNKVDQNKKSLAGAGFTLYKKDASGKWNQVKQYTAGNETSFEFKGLDDGDYKLSETKTPTGYNTISDIEFTISAQHDTTADDPKLISLSGNTKTGTATWTANTNAGSLSTDVVNKRGSILPSTGGMGTTVLYIGGAVLAAAAAFGIYQLHKKDKEA
ncbi:MAG: SpaH/EbpB family LPXTG-anchored major pilin [Coriobacteriaceae bacterium]